MLNKLYEIQRILKYPVFEFCIFYHMRGQLQLADLIFLQEKQSVHSIPLKKNLKLPFICTYQRSNNNYNFNLDTTLLLFPKNLLEIPQNFLSIFKFYIKFSHISSKNNLRFLILIVFLLKLFLNFLLNIFVTFPTYP